MPDPDDRGTFSNISKDKVERAIAEIHAGGPEYVLGLIDMLVEPGQGDDIKPHYALHCLAVFVTGLEDDKGRSEFSKVVASQLGGDRPKSVQEFLIQELQVAGGKEAVPALGNVLVDEQLCEPAARTLVAIGDGAAEQLRAALPRVPGNCRLTILQNLGVVRDERSVDALRDALGDTDREIRLAAVWGLANIGDVGSVDLLLKAADADGWERIQATDACFLLAERFLEANSTDHAKKIYAHLQKTRTEPSELYVREAAERAMAAIP
jgi:hypothetical protein